MLVELPSLWKLMFDPVQRARRDLKRRRGPQVPDVRLQDLVRVCTNDTDADARNCSLVGRLGLCVFDIIL
jgi:hypothetical protein